MAAPASRTVTGLALALILAAGACGSPSQPALPPDADEPFPDLAVSDPPHIVRALQSGLATEFRLIIRDSAAWQDFWTDLVLAGAELPEQAPPIDFATTAVVVAAMGRRERSGYTIDVTAYRRTAGLTTVTILSLAPPANCPSGPVLTTPIAVAAVATGTAVILEELSEEIPCPGS
jgi:hypothetical protein